MAVGLLGAVRAEAKQSQTRPSLRPVREQLPAPSWRYFSASPITAAPVWSPLGRLILTSVEGYIHVLDRRGSLLWNYTTSGGIVGKAGVDARGRIYVCSFTQRLYAIEPDGVLAWVFRSPVRFTSGPVVSGRRAIFGGSDQHLWAISSRATVAWRSRLPAPLATAPLLIPALPVAPPAGVSPANGQSANGQSANGQSAVAAPELIQSELLVTTRGAGIWTAANNGQFRRVIATLDDAERLQALNKFWFAGGATRAQIFDRFLGTISEYEGALFAGARPDGDAELILYPERAVWVASKAELQASPASKQTLLRSAPSAPPELSAAGTVYLPLVSGELAVFSRAEPRVCYLDFARGPLFTPLLLDEELVLAAGDGTVASYSVSAIGAACLWD